MKFKARTITGFGRGKRLGFPTLNVDIPERFDYQHGIYAARVWIDGKIYPAATHFGPSPTFDHTVSTLEFYVLNYKTDDPPITLEFELIKYLRPVKKFDNATSLSEQITEDVAATQTIYSQTNKV